jgi:single-strand DNA-binding protein
MLSQTIIIGRTTKEPEFRQTQNGVSVATFTIAVDRNFKNQNGEKETDFFNIVCWRGLAETVGRYLGKGRLVAVSGRLQNRSYEAKDGTKRYITEIVASEVQFLDRAKDAEQAQEQQWEEVDQGELPF